MSDKIQKNDNLNKMVVKAGVWYVISQILVRGISFLSTPVFSRLLSTEDFGVIRIYESWLRVFFPVLTLSLYASIERAKFDFRENFDQYISSIQTLFTLLIAVCSVVVAIFHTKVGKILSMTDSMLVIMMMYLVIQATLNCVQRREKLLLHYKSNIVIIALSTVLPTVSAVICLLVNKYLQITTDLVKVRIWGFYIPQILVGLVYMWIVFYRGRTGYNKEYWKYGVLFSVPLIPHVLSMEILNQSDKLMVSYLTGKHETGIFSMATTVMWIMLLLSQAVGDAWLPWIYEKLDKKEYGEIAAPWYKLIHGFGIATWIVIMITPELVMVLGGSKYMECIYVIPPLLCSTMAHFFSYSYISIEQFYKKNLYITGASLATVVLNIFLNYFCIIRFGYIAAAYTTAVCYLFLTIVHGVMLKKLMGITIIPLRKTLMLTAFYYVIMLFTMRIYELNIVIRYGILILVVAILGFVFRKLILEVKRMFLK